MGTGWECREIQLGARLCEVWTGAAVAGGELEQRGPSESHQLSLALLGWRLGWSGHPEIEACRALALVWTRRGPEPEPPLLTLNCQCLSLRA